MKNKKIVLETQFVKVIPDKLDEHTLYVSMDYATVAHNCCCGCGQEVVTPLSPTDWKLTYDGESVSLFPSVGNWSFDCQSHYWIDGSEVKWAEQWSKEQIAAGRMYDRQRKTGGGVPAGADGAGKRAATPEKSGFWAWVLRLFTN